MPPLVALEDEFPDVGVVEYVARYWSTRRLGPLPDDLHKRATSKKKADQVEVFVNHGRWMAQCPDCRSAQLASRKDRKFLCVECGNGLVGGVWRPVVWPREHAAIERVLDARPIPQARGWVPGETLADLKRQDSEALEGSL